METIGLIWITIVIINALLVLVLKDSKFTFVGVALMLTAQPIALIGTIMYTIQSRRI